MNLLSNRLSVLAPVAIVSVLAGTAIAQPADRAAAITQGIAAAQAAVPNSWFLKAELKPEDGTWIVDVEVAPASGSPVSDVEVNAFTFAVGRTKTDAVSSSKAAKNAAEIAAQSSATVTLSSALASAIAAAPAGAVLREVELELENSPTALFYQVEFLNGGLPLIIRVNAATGEVLGGTGGGGGGGGGGAGGNVGVLGDLGDAVDAGPAVDTDGFVLEAALEVKKGATFYKLEVVNPDNTMTEYRLNAAGDIVKAEPEAVSARDGAKIAFVRANIASATISLAQGIRTALEQNPGGVATSAEWDSEGGRLVAKVRVRVGSKVATAYVDAQTGFVTGGPTTPPPPTTTIDMNTALTTAATLVAGAQPFKVELDSEVFGPVWEVQVINLADFTSRVVKVNATTGAVISNTARVLSRGDRRQAQAEGALLGNLTLSFAQAAAAALPNPNPAGAFAREVEIDIERGRIGYEVEVRTGKSSAKWFVDGQTGALTRKR